MSKIGIISAREPLTNGGEVLRRALVDSAALARLLAAWQVRVSPKGGVSGRRGPAWSVPRV